MKKITIILAMFFFTTLLNAKPINPEEIIKLFDVCKIKSSLGQMCKMNDFKSYDYFKGLSEEVNDNVVHYKDGDFWEFFFTIEKQEKDTLIVGFEDIALRGTYKSYSLLKFVYDKSENKWQLHSIKNLLPEEDSDFQLIK